MFFKFRSILKLFYLFIIFFMFANNLFANMIINYSSSISDIQTNNLNITVKLKFTIQNDKSTIEWERERYVNIIDGKYSVRLGLLNPIKREFFNGNYFICVSVKKDRIFKLIEKKILSLNTVQANVSDEVVTLEKIDRKTIQNVTQKAIKILYGNNQEKNNKHLQS
ncbi:secreted protein, partial [Candidatus Magnetomorum sp. HK-1]